MLFGALPAYGIKKVLRVTKLLNVLDEVRKPYITAMAVKSLLPFPGWESLLGVRGQEAVHRTGTATIGVCAVTVSNAQHQEILIQDHNIETGNSKGKTRLQRLVGGLYCAVRTLHARCTPSPWAVYPVIGQKWGQQRPGHSQLQVVCEYVIEIDPKSAIQTPHPC